MRTSILSALTLGLFSIFVNRVYSSRNGFNIPSLQLPLPLGLTIPSAAPIVPTRNFGFPRPKPQPLPFLPVPVVKKVTHHHIHHVIAHKGVVKSKYSNGNNGFDLDNKENDNKNINQLNYNTYKEDFGLKGDSMDNVYKSAFLKRGGDKSFGAQPFDDLLAQSTGGQSRGQNRAGIRGFIGGQKAEFLPLIIGIIDDESDLTGGQDSGREYSSRIGLMRPEGNRKEYIPSKETMRLFEQLAKLGFK